MIGKTLRPAAPEPREPRSRLVIGAGDRGDDDHPHAGRTLESVAPVLGLYYRAIAGRNAALLPDASERDPQRYPDTHTTIRLPAHVARFAAGRANFDWYKVALTHRAAHYSAGTFAFDYARQAACLERLRPSAAAAGPRSEHSSELEFFFGLFSLRDLAIEVFTTLEALRIDEWAKRRYPGLAADFERVQRYALVERAGFVALRSPRDALAEILIQASLGATALPSVPALLHAPIRQLLAICERLARDDARVEDSAEATLRMYSLIARLPNLAANPGRALPLDRSVAEPDGPWPTDWPEPERNRLEGEEVMHVRFDAVTYRDRLGSRITDYKGAGPLDQQAIYRFTQADTRGDEVVRTIDGQASAEERPAPPPEPMAHDHHDHFAEDEAAHESGELHSHEREVFIHREWDHVAQSYKRAWCRVRESRLDSAPSARFFDATLRAYGALVPGIRRQFERIAFEGLRRVHGLPFGEEIDLDAAIQSRVDVRAGLAPDDKVYIAREPQARDVTLALLVDISCSTAEHVPPPADAAVRAALAALHHKDYRTILDLEKEALVLLMAALERTGDSYGIYCFSGTGREDVKFQVLKDIDERLSNTVAARFDKLRPLHTTRMGAAIRHATRKLRAHESRTRLLLLLSDGRPFDLDYGQQYGEGAEVEYAQHDTRQALIEARQLGIRPFVLTIDPQGTDYLRSLCDGFDYEVIDDLAQLPARLVKLYRGLTARGPSRRRPRPVRPAWRLGRSQAPRRSARYLEHLHHDRHRPRPPTHLRARFRPARGPCQQGCSLACALPAGAGQRRGSAGRGARGRRDGGLCPCRPPRRRRHRRAHDPRYRQPAAAAARRRRRQPPAGAHRRHARHAHRRRAGPRAGRLPDRQAPLERVCRHLPGAGLARTRHRHPRAVRRLDRRGRGRDGLRRARPRLQPGAGRGRLLVAGAGQPRPVHAPRLPAHGARAQQRPGGGDAGSRPALSGGPGRRCRAHPAAAPFSAAGRPRRAARPGADA